MTASGPEIQPGNSADSAWILPRARERASRPDPLTPPPTPTSLRNAEPHPPDTPVVVLVVDPWGNGKGDA